MHFSGFGRRVVFEGLWRVCRLYLQGSKCLLYHLQAVLFITSCMQLSCFVMDSKYLRWTFVVYNYFYPCLYQPVNQTLWVHKKEEQVLNCFEISLHMSCTMCFNYLGSKIYYVGCTNSVVHIHCNLQPFFPILFHKSWYWKYNFSKLTKYR